MSEKQSSLVIVTHSALLALIVIIVGILAALHDLDGQSVVAVLSGAGGIAAGSSTSIAAMRAGSMNRDGQSGP